MSSQSQNTTDPIPVGPWSENHDLIQVIIHNPDVEETRTTRVDPVPSNPLRLATDNLNAISPQIPPTGGNSKTRRMSGKRTPTKSVGKEKDSRSRSVKCHKCGQIGHIKKHCKQGQPQRLGGTRGDKNATLIQDQLRVEAEQAAGAQDAQAEMQQDAEESVALSSQEPKLVLPEHYSSLSSPLENLVEEKIYLERVLHRCSNVDLNTPYDAFMFWFRRALTLFILFFLILCSIYGRVPVSFGTPFLVYFFYYLMVMLHRNCVEKRYFYETYIAANQIGVRRIEVESAVISDFDHGIKYDTEIRAENHSLKDAELKPGLFEVKLYQPNNEHWILNHLFPTYFHKRPERMVVSSTLLKHQICDVDVYYDSKQLLLKSQMQSMRNQKVAISTDDLARYGDIYGNTALLAAIHNEATNKKKRAVLDFLHSPVSV